VTINVIPDWSGVATGFIRVKVEENFPAPTEVMKVTSVSSNPENSDLMLQISQPHEPQLRVKTMPVKPVRIKAARNPAETSVGDSPVIRGSAALKT
jgi:hypothetical protein